MPEKIATGICLPHYQFLAGIEPDFEENPFLRSAAESIGG
jgi:hypothetical protein